MSDRPLLIAAAVLGLAYAVFSIAAVVLMFLAADRGDTAETVAWGVVSLGFWLSPTGRREQAR